MFDFRKTKGTFVGSWFSDVSFFTTQVTRKDVPFLCPFLCFLFLFPFYVNVSMLCNVVLFPFHGFFSHSDARHPLKNPCSSDHLLF